MNAIFTYDPFICDKDNEKLVKKIPTVILFLRQLVTLGPIKDFGSLISHSHL